MNDRELLEKAARAVGLRKPAGIYSDGTYWWYNSTLDGEGRSWNPLKDDGDAFRLMVALSLEVSVDQVFGIVEAGREDGSLTEHYDGGSYEAIARRAITRAAAALANNV